MHNLTEFLAKYKHWFLFVALEVLSMVLLFRFNDYQGSVWFTSANYVTGVAYEATSKVTSYLSMGALNEKLTKRNVELEQQVRELSSKLYDKTKDSIYLQKGQYHFLSKFRLIQAKVVSNSLDRPDNFITINKGTWDGVRKDMGVACGNGVVGIVYMAGIHYAVVIPVLNSKSNISCSIQGRNYFGYLHWNGGDSYMAYLDDVPRHAKFKLGDRIVTSGYSSVFPAGVLVGKIKHVYNSEDGLSYRLAVQLSTDFGNLRDVCVIDDASIREQRQVIKAAQDSIKPLEEQNATQGQ
ncbi:rod shape-determining protein MreC [Prevotella histicola]|uniref:rod shape-determining protein MreC n=1 Tax=Prevotella histicola TaxID=470565 RepID=UPI0028EFF819|nr:rod shape-determining protein MreC [Prevotella histicola]